MQCPHCDAETADDVASCPACGAELHATEESSEAQTDVADEHAPEPRLWWNAPRRLYGMLALCYLLLAVNVAVLAWAIKRLSDGTVEVAIWSVALLVLNPFVWLLVWLIAGWHRQIGQARRDARGHAHTA